MDEVPNGCFRLLLNWAPPLGDLAPTLSHGPLVEVGLVQLIKVLLRLGEGTLPQLQDLPGVVRAQQLGVDLRHLVCWAERLVA